MLLTTHYLEEAEILCDRVAIMDHGKILEMGTVDQLVNRRTRSARSGSTGSRRSTRASGALPGVVKVSDDEDAVLLGDDRRAGHDRRPARPGRDRGVEPASLAVRPPSLEDVFLALTGRGLRD